MNEINKKIRSARKRLMLGQFFSILTWAVFISLTVALIGVAIPKIWHLSFLESQQHRDAWLYSWILGATVVGFLTTAILTYVRRKSILDVATEVDRRFGLKERLSSAISIDSDDGESPAALALIDDASRQAETIEIREQFKLQPRLSALLPLLPLAVILGLLFVPDAQQKVDAADAAKIDREKASVKVEAFKKKLEKTRKQLDAKGLKDASPDVKALAKKFDKLSGEDLKDRKNTLVKINDIKKEIENRRKSLGDSKRFRENLNKLKDLGKGMAKKMGDALAEGKFDDAKKAMKELAKKLKEGKLTKAEAKKLLKDLNELAEQMEKAAEQRKKKMEDLQKQVDKAAQEGDLDKAARLQQKLDAQKQMDKQQQKMDQIAKQLKQCAECMKNGNAEDKEKMKQAMQAAAEQLEGMEEELEQLQQQMQEMENLEDLEQMAEDLKMPGQDGDGEGQGEGQGGKGKGDGKGDFAQGEGKGEGRRDIEEEDTGGFKAGVKGKVGQGEKVVTGNADGNNISGRSVSEVAELIKASTSKNTDPTQNLKLPKKHREHARQYFKALGEQ